MEGIFNILKSDGIEISDETKKKITKSLSSEYKSIVEYNNLKKKLEDLNIKVEEKTNLENELNNLKEKNNELNKLYSESKNTGYKFDVLKKGVNEKFVDFVTSDILKNKTEEQNFTDLLNSYVKDNPQYLTENYISVSTTPKVKENNTVIGTNEIINKLIRGE